MDPSSKNRLSPHLLPHFPGDTLFDRVARAVCRANCLPRKELYEAWETARRVHRRFRGGRVVDLAAGHGLLAQVMLILDRSLSAGVAVDLRVPQSAAKLRVELQADWPFLADRFTLLARDLGLIPLQAGDIVVAAHACGSLTDRILERAVSARCRVAVLPCCHDLKSCDTGGLEGWLDGPLAIDAARAAWLRSQGYRVVTQTIPSEITPKNRLLMGEPL